MNQSEVPWHPNEEDVEMIQLMFDIGRTYNEYYFFNYGRDLGLMFERLASTMLKIGNGLDLNASDKTNYLKLKDKLKNKIDEMQNPRFQPGDLAATHSGVPCTVMSKPYVDKVSRKVIVDILCEGCLVKFDSRKLKAVARKKKTVT